MTPQSPAIRPIDDEKRSFSRPNEFELDGFAGLSDAEASERLKVEGPNELPSSKPRGIWPIALEVAREPMFLLLVAAGSLYLLMGKLEDALMLLGFVFVVMGITIVQERRTERALDALRDLSSPRALVIRGGQRQRIAGREVVKGDILLIAEGDRVPADALLRRTTNLSADESLLTGESVPVRKAASSTARELSTPGGDDLPSLFAGTLVTSGQGSAEVLATGARTELGQIGKSLQKIEPDTTPLQKETGRIVRILAVAGIAACLVVIVAYALTRGGEGRVWKEAFLAGIAMAMAILPEEFPVVLTVFLALGAWRISRSHVLTRRMPAIETLGAATVLCVDKTGTLTQNQMALKALTTESATVKIDEALRTLPKEFESLLQTAVLASKPEAFDPMERALHDANQRLAGLNEHDARDWSIKKEYPLTAQLLAVTHVWQRNAGSAMVLASKGAPEAILDLCRLSAKRRSGVEKSVKDLASQGLRVLGVARGELSEAGLPAEHRALALSFVGLLAFEDPLRSTVPGAVAECRTAGIRVVMITGDYPETARSIAAQAGLSTEEPVISGQELNAMSDAQLAQRIRHTQVFARVVPEQKLRIVTALKVNGEIVAMTGDGVNDAPALKAAHIGIAMGGRGSDVAREAAALVLLDDDFTSIVSAIKLGRRIYDNIKKAIIFILAVHVPIAGLSIAPIFLPSWPLLLLPVHIVFLELIIDPSCSIIFEAEAAEADVMRRPPRSATERLFSHRTVLMALAQGLSVLAVCLAIVFLAQPGHGADAARALSFATLVVSFLAIILVNRSSTQTVFSTIRAPNPALWWVIAGAALLLAAVLGVPALQKMFSFAPLHPDDLAWSLLAGVGCLLWLEVFKVKSTKPSVPVGRLLV
jgi:Ca2+-transporting ATPase